MFEVVVAAYSESPDSRLDGVHVLIAEDHGDTRELLAGVFEYCGAQVTTVGAARAALAAIEDAAVQVVVTDVTLSDESGTWLLPQLRTRGCHAPVVAVTGHVLDRAASDGFALVLLKPVDPWRLCREVAQILGLPPAGSDRSGPSSLGPSPSATAS